MLVSLDERTANVTAHADTCWQKYAGDVARNEQNDFTQFWLEQGETHYG